MKDFLKSLNIRFVLVIVLSFVLGWQMGHRDIALQWLNYKPTVSIINREPPQNIDVDFKLFWETWDLVSKEYIDKKAIDPNKLFYGAIAGMVSAIGDPYTVFLPPEQQKSSKEELNGSFDGVGIQLGFDKDKRLVVVAPLKGTPAEKAGIKPKDMIVKIGDKDTNGISLPEAVKLIRGPRGTKISLTTFRDGQSDTNSYDLTRETIVVKSVETTFKETSNGKKVAVIKLSRFGERTEDEWNESVDEILSGKAESLILDLRNNPGGFLEGAVFVVSEFLEGGDAVLQEDNEGKRVPYKVNRSGKLTKIPMVILINKGSASASEIVAGALQDRKRARLVGEKSFGKGTIQQAMDLPSNTGIHITVSKWLTPNGRWVNAMEGLDPDVKIEVGNEDDDTKDLQMDKAIELLQ